MLCKNYKIKGCIKINCRRCVWGWLVSPTKSYCPFAKCIGGDDLVAKKSQKTVCISDVSRVDQSELLSDTQEGNR